jgi:hypothetical protein
MTKNEMTARLHRNHLEFTDYMGTLSAKDFMSCSNEKWSAGQQLEHICLSVKPLVQALGLPKFVIKILIGKANRPSKTYDELIAKYSMKLSEGGKAGGRFVPKAVAFQSREKLAESLSALIQKLNIKIDSYSEDDLDTLILPHPLLGKITLREMIYFTMYHVQHHHKIAERNLNEVMKNN